MKDVKKTKKQLIEELDGLRGENTDLREKVAGVDVSAVERVRGDDFYAADLRLRSLISLAGFERGWVDRSRYRFDLEASPQLANGANRR